jgi:hypothetical protein
LDKSKDPVLSGDIEIDEMYQSSGNKGLKKNFHEKKDLNYVEEAPIKKTNHRLSQ